MTVLHVDRSELLDVLSEVADSKFLTEGRFVRLFEDRVSDWSGQHAVAVNSCGSGLFALFRQFPPTTVIVPANTFFATGAMAKEAGHNVVLADCAPNDFAMGLDQLVGAYERAKFAGKRVGLVVLTHVGWLAKEYEEIAFWCKIEGIPLIEDAAHVLGAERHYCFDTHRKHDHKIVAGALGCAAVFSLYPTKAVPAGEGGCIVTHDQSLANQVAEFRNYGKKIAVHGKIIDYGKKIEVAGEIVAYGVGFNLRLDEWTAAVAAMQMQRLDEIRDRRADAAAQLSPTVPLHSAVPLDGTMWYKYPVPADIPLQQEAGKIYALSDQLPKAMRLPGSFPNAVEISQGHKCVPIGEEAPNVEAILGKVAA
jgi:perosamine synthetase